MRLVLVGTAQLHFQNYWQIPTTQMAPFVIRSDEVSERRLHEMIGECFAHEMLALVAIDQISMIGGCATIADAAVETTGAIQFAIVAWRRPLSKSPC